MDIRYKIIKKMPSDRQILVRYFTDLLTPELLAVEKNADGSVIFDENNEPTRCRTDFLINFPLQIISAEEEQGIIMQSCPWRWLEEEERMLRAITIPDTIIDAITSSIENMSTTVKTITFEGTNIQTAETIKANNLIKIDFDVDMIYFKTIGNRATEYSEAEAQARKYKAARYTGTVPQYVASWVTANISGFTTPIQAADDIIRAADTWRQAAGAIRNQRLNSKKDVLENVPNAIAQWNEFVASIYAQLAIK